MKCEKCGKEMTTNYSQMLCSNPPMRKWTCQCGHVYYEQTGQLIKPTPFTW